MYDLPRNTTFWFWWSQSRMRHDNKLKSLANRFGSDQIIIHGILMFCLCYEYTQLNETNIDLSFSHYRRLRMILSRYFDPRERGTCMYTSTSWRLGSWRYWVELLRTRATSMRWVSRLGQVCKQDVHCVWFRPFNHTIICNGHEYPIRLAHVTIMLSEMATSTHYDSVM